MGEQSSATMNLDLNLGPGPEAGSAPSEAVNLDDWIGNSLSIMRGDVRVRGWRLHQIQTASATDDASLELDQLVSNSGNVSTLQAGEGSVATENRPTGEPPKTCENINTFMDSNVSEKTDDEEKACGKDGSFFDCNVCLDLARNPVVTCCGHLFCWPCLYQWLNVHSDAKECPVCKGEVTVKTVTPIYGRGNFTLQPVEEKEEEVSGLKVPVRPHARRVESLRQSLHGNALILPVEEMVRRLGRRFDWSRDTTAQRVDNDSPTQETLVERSNSLLNRILTSRGIREERSLVVTADDVEHGPNSASGIDAASSRLHYSVHAQLQRQANLSRTPRASALSSAERIFETYFRNPTTTARNQEQPPSVEDRDSFSSIAAGINSESQMDGAIEIDSGASLSTSSSSSSRRRNDTARVSDIGEEEFSACRRRRLN